MMRLAGVPRAAGLVTVHDSGRGGKRKPDATRDAAADWDDAQGDGWHLIVWEVGEDKENLTTICWPPPSLLPILHLRPIRPAGEFSPCRSPAQEKPVRLACRSIHFFFAS